MSETSVADSSEAMDAIVRRLDAIVSLLVQWDPESEEARSAAEQTIRLRMAGLRPVEIAGITGRHPNNVSRDISVARKDGRLPKSVK